MDGGESSDAATFRPHSGRHRFWWYRQRMADDPEVFIDGIHVAGIKSIRLPSTPGSEPDETMIPGLRHMRDITISGRWDPDEVFTVLCTCGKRFRRLGPCRCVTWC